MEIDDILFGCITDYPRQRHLFLLRDFVESFVEIGREANRRTDPGRALSLRAFSLSLFRLHRWPASIIVFTTVHHGGEMSAGKLAKRRTELTGIRSSRAFSHDTRFGNCGIGAALLPPLPATAISAVGAWCNAGA